MTRAELNALESRVNELIAERLAEGEFFHDLMDSVDPSAYEPYLHAIVMNQPKASAGDSMAIVIVLNAVAQFAALMRSVAQTVWRDEAEEIAEQDLP